VAGHFGESSVDDSPVEPVEGVDHFWLDGCIRSALDGCFRSGLDGCYRGGVDKGLGGGFTLKGLF
ncbi:MAG: hypothetical protein COW42_04795, partial [Deltaproteobacteria bacterium CG17_big_fil_post_rev_8_21_14_2_50_63_7]